MPALHTCISSYYLGRKQAGFPAGVQLLEQLFRTGGCYILYLICASQGRNITPAIAVGGNLMKVTTLMDIYNCLKGQGGEEIFLPENIMEGAGRCIHRMVELGG